LLSSSTISWIFWKSFATYKTKKHNYTFKITKLQKWFMYTSQFHHLTF
jgi:hypothetical protein